MGKTTGIEIDRLFSHAERNQLCVRPSDNRTLELVRRRVKKGEVERVARGLYARTKHWSSLSPEQRAISIVRSMQEAHPDWTFCAESAAVLYGLPVACEDLDCVHIAVSQPNLAKGAEGVLRHVVDVDDPGMVRGVRVTSFERTVFDCTRNASFARALAVADAALRLSGRRASDFVQAFSRFESPRSQSWRSVRAMCHADARSESAGESIARAGMIELGFCVPDLQVALPDPVDRGKMYRLDFVWPVPGGGFVFGEFDGRTKYENPHMMGGRTALRVLVDEQHRESRLSLYGAPIVRLSYRDVVDFDRLQSILTRYRIPRDKSVAALERRMVRLRRPSVLHFAMIPFSEE